MSEESRGNLLIALWFLSALALIALFISAGLQGELTSGHILLASVLLALGTSGSVFLLRLKDGETSQEKTKHHRIDSVLSTMSDDELIELKRRLSDSDLDEKIIVDSVGDDGEIVRRR